MKSIPLILAFTLTMTGVSVDKPETAMFVTYSPDSRQWDRLKVSKLYVSDNISILRQERMKAGIVCFTVTILPATMMATCHNTR